MGPIKPNFMNALRDCIGNQGLDQRLTGVAPATVIDDLIA